MKERRANGPTQRRRKIACPGLENMCFVVLLVSSFSLFLIFFDLDLSYGLFQEINLMCDRLSLVLILRLRVPTSKDVND